jgi:hopanoid biosynthesis associated RND transporter like protein HpnN
MARALAERLGASPLVERVDWGAPLGGFSPRAVRLADDETFERAAERLEASAALVRRPTIDGVIGALVLELAQGDGEGARVEDVAGLEALVRAVGETAAAPAAEPPPLATLGGGDPDAWQPLATPNGRFLILRVTPREDPTSLNADAEAVAEIRRVIASARGLDPPVDIGLTGVDVVEADETALATTDSAIASTIAAIVITALLIVAFHGWRKPVLAMAALLFGIAWSFGFLTLAIGHLQVLSVVFVVILLGIGIDFGIHLSTTLEEYRHRRPEEDFAPAMAATMRSAAPGITAGALTTAAAFLVTTFTDFRGVAEMGLIAAGGIVLCLLSMFTVYPALLALIAPRRRHITPLEARRFHVFRSEWLLGLDRRPRVPIAIASAATLAGLALAWGIRFDSDILAFQPASLPSVEWQRRLADEGDASVWFAVSVTDDLMEARRRAAELRSRETVSHVGGIAVLFPPEEPRRLRRLAAIDAATRADDAPTTGAGLAAELAGLAAATDAALAREDLPGEWRDALEGLRRTTGDALLAVERGGPEGERRVRSAYERLRGRVRDALDPSPLTPDDLPASLLAPYVDASDPDRPRYALEIHPRLDRPAFDSPLEPAFLARFVDDVSSVDPEATGVIYQIYHSSRVIRDSFVRAGLAALVVVVAIVLVMFRSVRDSMLAVAPVVMGFVLTLGVMRLIGQPINLANIIVLPLLFGIGVDNGIHMLHRYRLNPHERPLGLTHGTGKGIALTSLTTMAGFGTMMISRHKGISGLGLTLAIGIGLTLVACLLVMPAWLEWRQRHAPRRAPITGGTRVRPVSHPPPGPAPARGRSS